MSAAASRDYEGESERKQRAARRRLEASTFVHDMLHSGTTMQEPVMVDRAYRLVDLLEERQRREESGNAGA